MYSVLRLVPFAAAVAAVFALSPIASAISPEAAHVQLQLAKLLFTDGRYVEAFAAFEQVKGHDDPRHQARGADGQRQVGASPRRFLACLRRRPATRAKLSDERRGAGELRRRVVGCGSVRGRRSGNSRRPSRFSRTTPRPPRPRAQPCRTQQAGRGVDDSAGGAEQGPA